MDIWGKDCRYSQILHLPLQFPTTFTVRQGHTMNSKQQILMRELAVDLQALCCPGTETTRHMLRCKSFGTQAAWTSVVFSNNWDSRVIVTAAWRHLSWLIQDHPKVIWKRWWSTLYTYTYFDENKWVGANSTSSTAYKGWRDKRGGCERRLSQGRRMRKEREECWQFNLGSGMFGISTTVLKM